MGHLGRCNLHHQASQMTYGLVDGNCFFVSCERIFRPSLKKKPVIVLSNNDGCAVARSDEAKALGIKMGTPWFKIKHLADSHGLVALSSNFALYGDMSDRMMQIIGRFSPLQEIYSIDECFISLDGFNTNLAEYGKSIKETVYKEIGIPTCVGIGKTKTLAKLANHFAKKQKQWNGVCDLTALTRYEIASLMNQTPTREVWGIGRQLDKKLDSMGIQTVFDLVKLDPAKAHKAFSILMADTILELRGIERITLNLAPAPKQEIMSSRSFGNPITSFSDLSDILSELCTKASTKLRKQNSIAKRLMIFIGTSTFRKCQQYQNSRIVQLSHPTSSTTRVINTALQALNVIFKDNIQYSKAGIMLMDLVPAQSCQGELFDEIAESPKSDSLMAVMDKLNAQYGKNTLKVASMGNHDTEGWYTKQERKTPAYTTDWRELLIVKA